MPSVDMRVHPNTMARTVEIAGVRIREDTACADVQGRENRKVRKRATKIIETLQEPLKKILQPDESVFYIAEAQAPASLWDQLSFGWYIYQVTSVCLVFTNRRVLHLLLKRGGEWKRSLRSVNLGDVARAEVKGWLFSPTLLFTYRGGKSEKYWKLRRDDSKTIKLILNILLPASTGEATSANAMVARCPDCLAVLTPGVYQCAQCRLTFKDEKTMTRRSLFIPGGGYFYTGRWFLGIGDFIVESILLLMTLLWILIVVGLLPLPEEPGQDPMSRNDALFTAGFFMFLLAVEKWVTLHHCRRFIRDYIPTK